MRLFQTPASKPKVAQFGISSAAPLMVLALLLAASSGQKQCTDIDIKKSNLDVTAFGGARLCCHICKDKMHNEATNPLCCPSKDKNGDVRRSFCTAC